jgi:hypothetical protein
MNKRILRVVERGGPDDGDAGDERRAAFAEWSPITGCNLETFGFPKELLQRVPASMASVRRMALSA